MKEIAKWFNEQDVQFTKNLFKITNKEIANLYIEKYVKMMNDIHETNVKSSDYKDACLID